MYLTPTREQMAWTIDHMKEAFRTRPNFSFMGVECKNCRMDGNIDASLTYWMCPCGQLNLIDLSTEPDQPYIEPIHGPPANSIYAAAKLAEENGDIIHKNVCDDCRRDLHNHLYDNEGNFKQDTDHWKKSPGYTKADALDCKITWQVGTPEKSKRIQCMCPKWHEYMESRLNKE